jgi:hypothetical protein
MKTAWTGDLWERISLSRHNTNPAQYAGADHVNLLRMFHVVVVYLVAHFADATARFVCFY